MAAIKFSTNVPRELVFPYGDFKEKAGDYGVQFQYTVQADGSRDYDQLYATEFLHGKLQEAGVQKGSVFTITKIEMEGGRSGWAIGAEEARQAAAQTPTGASGGRQASGGAQRANGQQGASQGTWEPSWQEIMDTRAKIVARGIAKSQEVLAAAGDFGPDAVERVAVHFSMDFTCEFVRRGLIKAHQQKLAKAEQDRVRAEQEKERGQRRVVRQRTAGDDQGNDPNDYPVDDGGSQNAPAGPPPRDDAPPIGEPPPTYDDDDSLPF